MYRVILKRPCKCVLEKLLQENARQYSLKHGLPPNTREAGFGKVLLALAPFVAVGGVITYAKYDEKFRKLVETNVPGSSSILKVALQEEKPFKHLSETVNKQMDSVSKSLEGVTSTVTGLFSSSEKEVPQKTENVKSTKPTTTTNAIESKNKVTVRDSKPVSKETVPVAASKSAPEVLPKNILELEKSIEVSAALAVKEYNKAVEILKSFNEDVWTVVEKAVDSADISVWNVLKNKTSARDTSVDTAEKLAREAIESIEKCEIALSKITNPKNIEQVVAVRNKIKGFVDHINHVKDELYRNKDLANVSEKYWRSVMKARNFFIDEIESIFPGLNLSEKKNLNIAKDDLDLFLVHAYTHVLAYQKELQRLQTDGELRLKRAIEALRGENMSEAQKAQLEYSLEAEKRKLVLENQKHIFQIRADSEKKLRQQLKNQAEAHIDHLSEAIALKESEMRRTFNREMEDKLAVEKANYKLQLAAMLGKMRGMDGALQARAESERSAHQAQALWAACQALWSTVRSGDPGVHWKSKLRPLKSEIKAISKVAEGDELVAVILNNMPREAEERGVYPEDALRERFINVENVARKLALVSEDGASVPMYFLSFLQSLFVLRPSDPVSEDELKNKQFDYSKLDTYDILNRARFFVERGDLLQALKYMNLLQGAPRKVASDWLKETRLLLETQQAANTLMAHAAASGLLYL